MSQRLRRLLHRAEEHLREQEFHRRLQAQAREAEIMHLADASVEEKIALSRTIHGYDGTLDQARGYEVAVDRIVELYEDAERRWEAGERPGQVGSGPVAGRWHWATEPAPWEPAYHPARPGRASDSACGCIPGCCHRNHDFKIDYGQKADYFSEGTTRCLKP